MTTEELLGFAGLALALVVTIILCLRHPKLLLILLVAFGLRAGAALIHVYVMPLPDGTTDAVGFEEMAWKWAEHGFGAAVSNFGERGIAWSYVHAASLVYVLVGRSALLLQSFSVLAGVAAVLYTYRLVLMIWGQEWPARKSAWIIAVFPMMVQYSALTMRESFIVLITLWSLIYVVRWVETRSYKDVAIVFAISFLHVFFHAPMVVGAMVFGAIVAWDRTGTMFRRLFVGRIRIVTMTLVTGLLAMVGVFWVQIGSFNLPYVGQLHQAVDLAVWVQYAEVTAHGGAAYPAWLLPESVAGVIPLTPARVAYLLFAPFPWDVRSPRHLVGVFDSVLYLTVAWWMFKSRAAIWANPSARIIFLMLIPTLIAFSWGVSNFGAAMRHRMKFIAVFLALAALAVPRLRFGRPK